jgi:hypothetical protein
MTETLPHVHWAAIITVGEVTRSRLLKNRRCFGQFEPKVSWNSIESRSFFAPSDNEF